MHFQLANSLSLFCTSPFFCSTLFAFVSLFFTFFISVHVLHKCCVLLFPSEGFWIKCLPCLDSDGELVSPAIAAVSVRICIPSQYPPSKLRAVCVAQQNCKHTSLSSLLLDLALRSEGMQITLSRAPVSRWHPPRFFLRQRDVFAKRRLKCIQCILNLKQESFVQVSLCVVLTAPRENAVFSVLLCRNLMYIYFLECKSPKMHACVYVRTFRCE